MSSQTSQLVKRIRSRASHRHRPVSSRLITSVYITLGAFSCPRLDRWLITFVYIILIPAPRSMADQTKGLPPVELFVRATCSATQSRGTTSRTVRPRAGEQPHGQSDPEEGLVECCFTSTETVGLLGTGAQDGHLDFHTAPELCSGCK